MKIENKKAQQLKSKTIEEFIAERKSKGLGFDPMEGDDPSDINWIGSQKLKRLSNFQLQQLLDFRKKRRIFDKPHYVKKDSHTEEIELFCKHFHGYYRTKDLYKIAKEKLSFEIDQYHFARQLEALGFVQKSRRNLDTSKVEKVRLLP